MSAFALGKSGSHAFDLTILFYAGALLVNRVCQTHVTHTYTAISLSTIAGWVTQDYTQPGTARTRGCRWGKKPTPSSQKLNKAARASVVVISNDTAVFF